MVHEGVPLGGTPRFLLLGRQGDAPPRRLPHRQSLAESGYPGSRSLRSWLVDWPSYLGFRSATRIARVLRRIQTLIDHLAIANLL